MAGRCPRRRGAGRWMVMEEDGRRRCLRWSPHPRGRTRRGARCGRDGAARFARGSRALLCAGRKAKPPSWGFGHWAHWVDSPKQKKGDVLNYLQGRSKAGVKGMPGCLRGCCGKTRSVQGRRQLQSPRPLRVGVPWCLPSSSPQGANAAKTRVRESWQLGPPWAGLLAWCASGRNGLSPRPAPSNRNGMWHITNFEFSSHHVNKVQRNR